MVDPRHQLEIDTSDLNGDGEFSVLDSDLF